MDTFDLKTFIMMREHFDIESVLFLAPVDQFVLGDIVRYV